MAAIAPWTRIATGITIGAGGTYPNDLATRQAIAISCEGAVAVAFMIATEISALMDGDPPFTIGYFVPDTLYDDYPVTPQHLVDLAPAGLEMVNAYELSGSIAGAMHDITSKPRIILVRGLGGLRIPVTKVFPILKSASGASDVFINYRVYA